MKGISAVYWINVKEMLPVDQAIVMVCNENGMSCQKAIYLQKTNSFILSDDLKEGIFLDVTHWLPIPEEPFRKFY